MKEQVSKVRGFHRAIDEKVVSAPELLGYQPEADRRLSSDLRQLIAGVSSQHRRDSHLCRRAMMAVEELAEWIEAHLDRDLNAAADALGDRLYVILGDGVATGLPVEDIFAEVHRSNMTKAKAKEDTGKATKPETFETPNLEIVLNKEALRKNTDG